MLSKIHHKSFTSICFFLLILSSIIHAEKIEEEIRIHLPTASPLQPIYLGKFLGLSLGGSTIFGVLCASASYIAAPAAIRIALPEASPTYYLTSALAITFPFNIVLGLPLYLSIAKIIFGVNV